MKTKAVRRPLDLRVVIESSTPFEQLEGEGPRIGCGWCLWTLAPSASGGHFVRCCNCTRIFHEHCWQNRKCPGANCGCDLADRVEVAAPHPIDTETIICTSSLCSPNSIEDKPIGLSTTVLFLQADRAHQLLVRNNSSEVQYLEFGQFPAWISVVCKLHSLCGPIGETVVPDGCVCLDPRQQAALIIKSLKWHATSARLIVSISDKCQFEIRTGSEQRDELAAIKIGLIQLLLLHWALGAHFLLVGGWSGFFAALLTLIMLLAVSILLAPGRCCRGLHAGLARFADQTQPGSLTGEYARRVASELSRETEQGGTHWITMGLASTGAVLLFVFATLISLPFRVYFPGWSSSGMVWTVLISLYAAVVFGGSAWVLRDFLDVDDWVPAKSRMVR